jgi:hypothetical protein
VRRNPTPHRRHYAVEHDLLGAKEAAEQYRNDPATDFHAMVAEKTGLERSRAKTMNFGLIYGMGLKKLVDCPEREGKTIMRRHAADLPFMALLSRECMNTVMRNGFMELYDGARRHFNLWEAKGIAWEKDAGPCDLETARARTRTPGHPWFGRRLQQTKGHAALNSLVQGSAARQTKIWLRNLYREGIIPMLSMHDAVEVSVSSPEQAERIAQLGREAIPLHVPVLIDAKFGRSWGDGKHEWSAIPEPAAQLKYTYQPKSTKRAAEKPAAKPKSAKPKGSGARARGKKKPVVAEQTAAQVEPALEPEPAPADPKPAEPTAPTESTAPTKPSARQLNFHVAILPASLTSLTRQI